MIGVLYNEVNKYNAATLPSYPTLSQRLIARIKNFFAREEEPTMVNGVVDMLALTCQGPPNVCDALDVLDGGNIYPTIERFTKKEQGWYVRPTKKANFLKVASGHRVRYYSLAADQYSLYDNPFYNVECIISEIGDRDDIHKKAKKKKAAGGQAA